MQDSAALANSPLLRQLQQQIQVAQQNRLVEQARLKPNFLVGLFSQMLTDNQLINGQELYFEPGYRFNGGQIGVTLPLLGNSEPRP